MFGDDLSGKKLQIFTGDSAEELKEQLDQIRVPYHIYSIYSQGPRHYAWINCGIELKVVKKKTKKKTKKK